jgi:hypothetical protein
VFFHAQDVMSACRCEFFGWPAHSVPCMCQRGARPSSPTFDDCGDLACEGGVSLEVYRAALQIMSMAAHQPTTQVVVTRKSTSTCGDKLFSGVLICPPTVVGETKSMTVPAGLVSTTATLPHLVKDRLHQALESAFTSRSRDSQPRRVNSRRLKPRRARAGALAKLK